jgi:hypothetical protein
MSTDISEEHVSVFSIKEKAKQETSLQYIAMTLHAGFLLCLFIDPEDGGEVFLRNRLTFN